MTSTGCVGDLLNFKPISFARGVRRTNGNDLDGSKEYQPGCILT